MGRVATDPLERYRSKITMGRPDECWPWTSGRFDKGYGAFRVGGKQVKAHRFGYEALVGPIPDGLYVLHHCDNPPCQNPAHWFLGTHEANARDRNQKGRQAQGVEHARRSVKKLSVEAVLAIRAAYQGGGRQVDLARRYGISQTMVSKIVRQDEWGQLVDDGHGSLQSTSKYRRRLSDDDHEAIRSAYRGGLTQSAIATQYGISQEMVSRLVRR